MKNIVALTCLCLLLACVQKENNVLKDQEKNYRINEPYLVVLSMDGFRWDYPEHYATPHLDSIASYGVKAKSLQPSFPSKTFPNHYTIATGLFPANHGIVMNSFTDPELGRYRLSDREAVQNPDFYFGEPIWVTAEKQHVRSACFYWPGSEAPIKGYYPGIWKKYDESVPYESRMDSIISWLRLPVEQRPHLIMWYFDEPDHVGHNFGPAHPNTRETVEKLDSLVGVFCTKVNTLDSKDSINLVFTSDHGMGKIVGDRAFNLRSCLKDGWVKKVEAGNPVVMIQPEEGYLDSVVSTLQKVEHMHVYTKKTMPKSFHYTNSDRIFEVVCVADSSWSIFWDRAAFPSGGTHGYDPVNKDMHAIFYGIGPAFKQGYVQPAFQNIHLYSLFAKILNLSPAPTDGSLDEVKELLKEEILKKD